MTGNFNSRRDYLPFIARFAQPIVHPPHHPLRYDRDRQIAQALVNGEWVDAVTVTSMIEAGTRVTKIVAETTDDQ